MSERKPRITRVRGRKTVERPPPSIGEYEVADSWPPLSPVPQVIERQPIHRSDGYRARALYVVIAIIVVVAIWLGVILAIHGLLPIHLHTVTVTPTTIAIYPTFTLPKATITTTIISTKTSTITKTVTIPMTPSISVNLQVANALTDLIRKTLQGNIENWTMDSVKYLLSGFLYDGELEEFELKSLNETLHQHLNLTLDNNLIALIMALQSAYSSGNLNEEIDDICKLANHALGISEKDCRSVLSQSGGSSRS